MNLIKNNNRQVKSTLLKFLSRCSSYLRNEDAASFNLKKNAELIDGIYTTERLVLLPLEAKNTTRDTVNFKRSPNVMLTMEMIA